MSQLVGHDFLMGLARIRGPADPFLVAVLRGDVGLDDLQRLNGVVARNRVRRNRGVAVEEGVGDRDRPPPALPVRTRDLVERVLVRDRVHSIDLVDQELPARGPAEDQAHSAPRIVVPRSDAGAHFGQAAAGHARLPAGLHGDADALAAVELSPPEREAVVEARRGAPGEPERPGDPQGAVGPAGVDVVGRPVDPRHAVGDPAAEAGRVARLAARLARQQDAVPRPDLEEEAEAELDGAVDTFRRIEEEEHPVALGQHRQAENSHRNAVRPDTARLANEDRAAGNEALQHVLDLHRVVRRRHVRGERRRGGPDLAEHEDRRTLDHPRVGGQDVDDRRRRSGNEGGGEENYSPHLKAKVSLAGTATSPCRLRCDQRSLSPSVT
ncbi:MAG: hypothetical protein OXG74_00680 [Acidobacteria bacterium]|nr:hypothetical protein [Acidobacteriota bacterium]